MADLDEVPSLIERLYEIVDRLQELFPERRFTPDGNLRTRGRLIQVAPPSDHARFDAGPWNV